MDPNVLITPPLMGLRLNFESNSSPGSFGMHMQLPVSQKIQVLVALSYIFGLESSPYDPWVWFTECIAEISPGCMIWYGLSAAIGSNAFATSSSHSLWHFGLVTYSDQVFFAATNGQG